MAHIELSGPVVGRKICIPNCEDNQVSRPRLHSALDALAERRVALVKAPPGYGKTALVSSWARRTKMLVAWLTLDSDDDDPSRLCRHCVAAINKAVGCLTRYEEKDASWPTVGLFVDDILASLEHVEKTFVLVIDDCHVLDGHSESWAVLEKIVALAPACLRIAFLSRKMPEFELSGLYARGELMELGENDLRFSEREALSYLLHGASASVDFARAANEYLEGWPIALSILRRLIDAADGEVSWQETSEGRIVCVNGEFGEAFLWYDQIVAFVLSSLNRPVRDFAAAVFCIGFFSECMASYVAETSLDEAADCIRKLLDEGLLKKREVVGGRTWYACAPIVTDACRHEMSEADRRRRFIRAAIWCKDNKLFADAVKYSMLAGDFDLAEKVVWDRFMTMFKGSDFQTIDKWISALPETSLRKPRVRLMLSLPMAQAKKLDAMDESVALVMRTLDEARKDRYYCLAKICAACAKATSAHRDEARALAQDVLPLLDGEDVYLRGLAHQIIAESYMESDIVEMQQKLASLYEEGEWRLDIDYGHSLLSTMTMVNSMLGCFQSQNTLNETLAHYTSSASLNAPALTRMKLGEAGRSCHEARRQDFRRTVAAIEDTVRDNGIEIDIAYLYGLMSINAFSKGDVEESHRLFTLGLRESPLFVAYAHPSISQIKSNFEQERELPRCLANPDPEKDQPALLRLKMLVIYEMTGTVLIRDILSYISKIPYERSMERLQWLLVGAHFGELEGKHSLANRCLREAMSIAEKEGIRQVFFDDSSWLLPILKRTIDRNSLFQTDLFKALPLGRTSVRALSRLTPREKEIAVLLDSELSYAEIAERLFIAEETTRKHVKRILAKLGVHSRLQAVHALRKLAD